MAIQFSPSENHGINHIQDTDLSVYSVGISTGGIAEIRMAEHPRRRIIATTIDDQGILFAQDQIDDAGLTDQIELRLEDVAEPLPYGDEYFDYIYARLVLHYLPKEDLTFSLSSLRRVLKPEGRLFVVVRSMECEHPHQPDSVYDPVTELTEYTEHDSAGNLYRLRRHFFTEEELQAYIEASGFTVEHIASFPEVLFKDFMRTIPTTRKDNVIELLAIK